MLGAWLGLILFGMEMFEESIKKLGGPKLRQILQKYTNTGWQAVSISMVITAILNSSTLVSLLTLGFVWAGMMPLVNAVWVIVGANIWSTATWLIVALLGSGDFSVWVIWLPLITLWWILLLTTQSKYRSYRAKWFIGFGLFFVGIWFFKENMDAMQAVFDLAKYKDMNLWIFGLIGMVVTAIVHSSGAVGVMTLAALSSWVIWFEASFAIILGANVGTTFSSLLMWLHGNTAKRQIGIANFLFNLITVGIGIILFYPYIWITLDLLGYKDNLVMWNAIINFVFNLTTSLIFVPFLRQFTRLITWIIPDKQEEYPLSIISTPLNSEDQKYDSDIASIALTALRNDKKYIVRQTLEYVSTIRGIDSNRIEHNESDDSIFNNLIPFDNELHRKLYDEVTEELDLILNYCQLLSEKDLDNEDRARLTEIMLSFLSLTQSLKSIKNIRENIVTIRGSLDQNVRTVYYEILAFVTNFNRTVYAMINNISQENPTNIIEVLWQIEAYNTNLLAHTASMVRKGNIGDLDLSSLVNVCSEMLQCCTQIEKAIKEENSPL